MPAQLYFGPVNSPTHHVVHAADYANDGIDPESYEVPQGQAVDIHVSVQNRGDTEATGCTIQLYYMVPTTGFPILPGTPLIEQWVNCSIPPHSDYPTPDGDDGRFPDETIQYSFPDLGHFCLRGTVWSDSMSLYPGGNPPEDPMSAIHNIQVVPALPSPSPSPMYFAFAATNPIKKALATRVIATPLDPDRHARQLEALLMKGSLHRVLVRGTRFRAPAETSLVLGVERFVPRVHRLVEPCKIKVRGGQVPTLGHTGVLSAELAQWLHADRQKREHQCDLDVDLLPFESRQAIVRITPEGRNGEIYAVEIRHETKEKKPQVLGGLIVIYRLARWLL